MWYIGWRRSKEWMWNFFFWGGGWGRTTDKSLGQSLILPVIGSKSHKLMFVKVAITCPISYGVWMTIISFASCGIICLVRLWDSCDSYLMHYLCCQIMGPRWHIIYPFKLWDPCGSYLVTFIPWKCEIQVTIICDIICPVKLWDPSGSYLVTLFVPWKCEIQVTVIWWHYLSRQTIRSRWRLFLP